MPSNTGGKGPWGSGGSDDGGSEPGPDSDGNGPWHGPPGGGRGGPGGGPRGPGGGPGGWQGGPFPGPDLDLIIARAQAFIRRVLGGGGGGAGRGPFGAGGRGIALIGLGVVALWLASGFYRVEPDQEGVVLRFGGFTRITLPGLNYHLPWPIEGVKTPAVTRVNRIEIGYQSGEAADQQQAEGEGPGAREVPQESLMLTGDENIVDVNVALLWKINSAVAYLFNTRDPQITVKAVAESVLREVMGRTPIQPALGPMRAQIADRVMHHTQQILDQYKAGVDIVQVLLQKVDPPADVIESFRDVQRANTDAERMRNQADAYRNDIVPRAVGDAARIEALAQGDKQAAIARASGETKRFLSVLAAYRVAKDITMTRLYLDTMQDVLSHSPTVVLDDKVKSLLPFLPLGGPGETPVPPTTPTPPPGPPSPAPTAQLGSVGAFAGMTQAGGSP